MNRENFLHTRNIIVLAIAEEAKTHALQSHVEAQLPTLHRMISLPQDNPVPVLIEFITRYITHVPEFIEALTALTQKANIYGFAKNILDVAKDYFVHPPELMHDHVGLHALIDEAYLAHRLMEEVNDRLMMRCGVPLAPMDMTVSNIVVHNLLGDQFANELDEVVHHSIDELFQSEAFMTEPNFQAYIEDHKKNGWHATVEDWPCLAGDSSISLCFEQRLREC